MTEITGRRYVVTGAASGIGQATTEKLLRKGAEVISFYRNTPTAAVSRHIEVDLANPRSIDAALAQLDGDFNGLMNVAGIPRTAPTDLVETPILVDFEESMGKDNLDAVKQLLGRHATPADIADAILFMASDAARWINGHALVVDGGITGAVLSGIVPAPEI